MIFSKEYTECRKKKISPLCNFHVMPLRLCLNCKNIKYMKKEANKKMLKDLRCTFLISFSSSPFYVFVSSSFLSFFGVYHVRRHIMRVGTFHERKIKKIHTTWKAKRRFLIYFYLHFFTHSFACYFLFYCYFVSCMIW